MPRTPHRRCRAREVYALILREIRAKLSALITLRLRRERASIQAFGIHQFNAVVRDAPPGHATVCGMDAGMLVLVELAPQKKRTYWYVFEPSKRFTKPWWGREQSVYGNEHWLSFERCGVEVARCKFILSGPRFDPGLGDMPHGQLDILALEVAVEAQRRGIGRKVLLAIRERHPLPRLTALNDDAASRGFWDRVGWIRHESARGFFSERVTYSEL